MFTGIIEEIGNVLSIGNNSIVIECNTILEDIKFGDSIAVDGVCLTVTKFDKSSFTADVSNETLKVTKLSKLKKGDFVNLERAMLLTSRFGGHIVSGHVDSIGEVAAISKNNDFYDLTVSFSDEYSKYIIKKGSITIDGISLTIADLSNTSVKLAIIPHTFENTNLKTMKNGDIVNIEFDILGKYVEKNLLMNDNKSNITMDFLKNNGFM